MADTPRPADPLTEELPLTPSSERLIRDWDKYPEAIDANELAARLWHIERMARRAGRDREATLDATRPSDDAHMADWDVTTDSDHDPYGAADANRPMADTPRPADPLTEALDALDQIETDLIEDGMEQTAAAMYGPIDTLRKGLDATRTPRDPWDRDSLAALTHTDAWASAMASSDWYAYADLILASSAPRSDDALRAALENLATHHELERVSGNTHNDSGKCEFVLSARRALATSAPPSPDVEGLPDQITEMASALYETDPPESWMRTATDEYRKRAAAMLDIIRRDRAAYRDSGS